MRECCANCKHLWIERSESMFSFFCNKMIQKVYLIPGINANHFGLHVGQINDLYQVGAGEQLFCKPFNQLLDDEYKCEFEPHTIESTDMNTVPLITVSFRSGYRINENTFMLTNGQDRYDSPLIQQSFDALVQLILTINYDRPWIIEWKQYGDDFPEKYIMPGNYRMFESLESPEPIITLWHEEIITLFEILISGDLIYQLKEQMEMCRAYLRKNKRNVRDLSISDDDEWYNRE